MLRTTTLMLLPISIFTAAATAAPVVYSAAGPNAAAIQATVDAFRADLGANNGVAGGPHFSGRREINWDAPALDAFATPNLMPNNFFNNNSRRGALFSNDGANQFLVSQRNATNLLDPALRFGDIDPSYNAIFQVFSAQRLFAPRASTITEVTFRVPNDPTVIATVAAFGVVFCDVDSSANASMEFYNERNEMISTVHAPEADSGLSFLAVRFNEGERVSRVKIISGNTALASGVIDGAGIDVIAMDDFFYSEPLPPLCAADVDNGTGTSTPDGGVTIEDLLHYLNLFFAGATRADVDDGSGTGTPDYGVTIEDLLYFLARFDAGC